MTDRTPRRDVDPVPSSATAQLAAMRDQWLRPLVGRIEELSRENGRLEAERDALRLERDTLRLAAAVEEAPRDAPREPTAHQRREAFWHVPVEASEGLIARLRRLIGR